MTSHETNNCKKIWTYWEGKIPSIVKDCFATWELHLGRYGWEINILSPDDIMKFDIIKPKSYDSILPAHRADVIRLSLLYTHGGLWLDASVFLTESVDWLINKPVSLCGVQYWKKGKACSYIENWILYTKKPRNNLCLLWLETLNDIIDSNPVKSHKAYGSPCVESPEYFMAYQAFCMLRKHHPEFEEVYQAATKVTNDIFKYHGFNPLSKEKMLVKFTSDGRRFYPFKKFPLVYCYIAIAIVVILLIILACRLSFRKRS